MDNNEIKVTLPQGWKVRSLCLHTDIPDDEEEGGYSTHHYHLDGEVAYSDNDSSCLASEEDDEDDDSRCDASIDRQTESDEDPTN